jgi:hypothetical protein
VLLGAAQMAGSMESDSDGWPVLCKVRLELELGLLHDVWRLPYPGAVNASADVSAAQGRGRPHHG